MAQDAKPTRGKIYKGKDGWKLYKLLVAYAHAETVGKT